MFTTKFKLTLISAAIAALLPIHSTVAASGCENSVRNMVRSCLFETKEEINATVASCQGISDEEERGDCFDDALEERIEAKSTCLDQRDARYDACDVLAEDFYDDPLVDEGITFVDPDDIGDTGLYPNNPYVILQQGHTHVLAAEDEIVVVYVTEEVRDIQGVPCRVVADVVVEQEWDADENDGAGEWEYTPIEVTDDWFAQDTDANVYYCGEVAQNFEDGVLRDLDGSFESGLDLAKGGLLTAAMPGLGQTHRQEYLLGEAEDIVQYMDGNTGPTEDEGGDNEAFPCGMSSCLKTFDYAPLEPESTEYKYYLPGVGFVLAVSLEDGEIEEDGREEMVCAGDSLIEVLENCAIIEDAAELLEDLCEYHDEFCPDDDED